MTAHIFHTFSSQLVRTMRQEPRDEESVNARLLLRAGYATKVAAGIYSLLPLGLRVLGNVESVVRQEMTALGAAEVLMPALHPKALWETTGRWDEVDVLYKLRSRAGAELCLGPTHEETVTPLAAGLVRSYKDLPLKLFQLQTKFRDEPRPRSGLLRGREFRMKDLYSFHLTQEDLDAFYEEATAAYRRVFERLGIGERTVLTFASGGMFSRFSHEFQLLADGGEDTVFVSPDGRIAINKEIAGDAEALRLVFGGQAPALVERRAIEVGNIFKLGSRFSEKFDVRATDSDGATRPVVMGCYGIGTSRTVGAIAEVAHDDRGLRWPVEAAPYDVHVVMLANSGAADAALDDVRAALSSAGMSALVDDRAEVRAGEKFIDADLLGMPRQIVIGTRGIERREVELRCRSGAVGVGERCGIDRLGEACAAMR